MDNKKPLSTLNKKQKIILIAGIAAIAIIMMSGVFTTKKDAAQNITQQFDIEEYRANLESRLADIISHIDGAGDTGVMITLDSGKEYIYAQNMSVDESSDSDSAKHSQENKYYTVKSQSNGEEPILIRESEPKVRGVIIVCEGADNSAVRETIKNAVVSIFNIAENKISVNKISK
ncbi:MAG: hypothetical protein K6F76_04655 [Clostridiales bacterium]|nr:hypothetical protein [Clostridiales bacterium]